jgi:hypothetical protein
MFNSIGLDVFIGLIFIFLIYSLLATIVQEIIANKLAFRSKVLEKAILRMLEDGKTNTRSRLLDRVSAFWHMFGKPNLLKDKTIASWFYAHPLIKYLGEDNFYSKPAYITPQNFSKVIIDLLQGIDTGTGNTQNINTSVTNGSIYKLPIDLEADKNNRAVMAILRQQNNNAKINPLDTVTINKDTALFLRSLWAESGADVEKFKGKLEQWFNDTMDRASGWYKRYTQYILLIIGFAIAVTFNADAIAIYKIISKDKNAREQLVQLATNKKDAYGRIITEIKDTVKSNSDSMLVTRDSILNKAYQVVSDDANAAGQILGLGKPWKDTCQMWEDSVDNGFQRRFDSVRMVIKLIDAERPDKQRSRDSLQKMMEGKNAAIATLTKKIRDSLDKVNADTLLTIAVFKKMDAFRNRCEYINSQCAQTWFKYSPRQAGGAETFLGWLITALAVSLGAPFWFDLLNKVMKLRTAGTKISPADNTAGSNLSAPAPTTLSVNLNNQTSEEAVG